MVFYCVFVKRVGSNVTNGRFLPLISPSYFTYLNLSRTSNMEFRPFRWMELTIQTQTRHRESIQVHLREGKVISNHQHSFWGGCSLKDKHHPNQHMLVISWSIHSKAGWLYKDLPVGYVAFVKILIQESWFDHAERSNGWRILQSDALHCSGLSRSCSP